MPERCTCKGVAMGSYANQDVRITPEGKRAGIDRCILPAIEYLWSQGIETIESCCGHGLAKGYIAVQPGQENMMIALGYRRYPGQPGDVFAWPVSA